jgi:hypothetical protein
MKKKSLMVSIFITAIVVTLAVITANSQENVKSVQDSAFKELMRPQVQFLHDQHNGKAKIEDCSECHHVYKDGKKVEGEMSEGSECSACHKSKDEKYPLSLIMAYHTRCKGCHLAKKTGPIMCAECHRK